MRQIDDSLSKKTSFYSNSHEAGCMYLNVVYYVRMCLLFTNPVVLSGYADAEKVQLMVANQAVEDYCFSKILMYIPDLKTDTDRLSDAIELLRNHRYRILNNQSLEASKSMGINWIAGNECRHMITHNVILDVTRYETS